MTATISNTKELGQPIPKTSKHAVSVSLPLWSDNIGYEEGNLDIIKKLSSGYPRFVIHPIIIEFIQKACFEFASSFENVLVFPCIDDAQSCIQFIHSCHDDAPCRILCLDTLTWNASTITSSIRTRDICTIYSIYLCFYPKELSKKSKEFWTHSGTGISSRHAEFLLNHWKLKSPAYFNWNWQHQLHSILCQRIVDTLCLNNRNPDLNASHVHLYPSGMASIYESLRFVSQLFPDLPTIQFGFPYVDTLKLQEKLGNGVLFYGLGRMQDLQDLKTRLAKGQRFSALFCEFPTNPLLKSPPLKELYALAKEYGFIMIVDDTIGNFVNVNLLSFTDVLVSSLTKIFNGECNVLAGSLILNPNSSFYSELSTLLNKKYRKDGIWYQDLIVLEENSRNVVERIYKMNVNTENLVDFLIQHPKIQSVYYPKYTDTEIYKEYVTDSHNPGYGGLFSIVFHSQKDAITFYDSIQVSKGPSLGTNFTLLCPYTILAHYYELEWAASFGISSHLIRISVGQENVITLFTNALERL